MTARQFSGIRVVDLSRVLAGPLATQMLGDLGADIIKVERPGTGDESRSYGPPFFEQERDPEKLESAIFLSANRNKRSIAVDFSDPAGQDIVRRLIARSDVVVENFRFGTLAKFGLDYDSLRVLNPGLIYCSVTGYGQTGPYRERAGYDAIFQGEGGLMQSIGFPDGHPFGGPMRVGVSIVDVITSLYASIGIITALYERDARGGTGEHIDMALFDSTVGVMTHHAMHYLISGEVPKRRGNAASGGGVPSGVFQCLDGAIVITVGNDLQYRRFCEVLGRPDLAVDPRFVTNQQRVLNRDVIAEVLQEVFATAGADHWVTKLNEAGLAAGRVNSLAEVFASPQAIERGTEVKARHRSKRDLSMIANPIRFRNKPVTEYAPPPGCGEHTTDVLSELLGMGPDEIDSLAARKVLGQASRS